MMKQNRVAAYVGVVVDKTEDVAPLCERYVVLLVHDAEGDPVTTLILLLSAVVIFHGVLQRA